MDNQSFSQFSEDVRVLEFFGNNFTGVFLEVGANDPEFLSNTNLLERNGWHGVLIEPVPTLAQRLREKRPNSKVFEVAVSAPNSAAKGFLSIPDDGDTLAKLVFDKDLPGIVGEVDVTTIDNVLAQAGIQRIDFLSIDIEGAEIEALQGFSFDRYRPRLIIIEDHVHDLKIHRYLASKRYKLFDRTGCNGWYIPREANNPIVPITSRFELFRRYFLGMPFRRLRFYFKK
jgi:FkbM family methyltransferase